jgi:hypothetical protein
MTTSNRPEGYYHALAAGASDADVILYYDGKDFYAHGSVETVSPHLMVFIREKPISFERPDGIHDAPFIGVGDWLAKD